MSDSIALVTRLERYTLKYPQEVLLVHAQIDGEADQVIIFKGFSSSLMRPTAFDPEVPTLPTAAAIDHIDRLQGPYQPQSPQFLEQGLSLEDFLEKLSAMGL
ncbi:MAG: hypothetical protein WBB01_03255 [Phormidesmis sp.]